MGYKTREGGAGVGRWEGRAWSGKMTGERGRERRFFSDPLGRVMGKAYLRFQKGNSMRTVPRCESWGEIKSIMGKSMLLPRKGKSGEQQTGSGKWELVKTIPREDLSRRRGGGTKQEVKKGRRRNAQTDE